MINEKLINNIKEHGTFQDDWGGREQVLKKIGFRIGEKADYAIITGCYQPESMPQVLSALKSLLDRLQINYTLLSKEFCCGWMPFGQPAVMNKNEADIARSKELSREFITGNFRQAEGLGAKSIVLFCAACEPSYTNMTKETRLPVISYSAMLERHFPGGRLDMSIDYYAGCYRFRRRITTEPVDIDSAVRLLGKVRGLKVNHLDSRLCCYIPPHLEQLGNNLSTHDVVAICTGCYHNLRRSLHDRGDYQVWMLPELLLKSLPG